MQPEIYRSKIGKGLAAFIFGIITAVLILLIVLKAWAGIIVLVCLLAFITHLYATTYYTITGNTLKIRSGFIINITIDIATITKIEATNSVLSSPALSMDRIEVFYNKYDNVIISPGDKTAFVARLKEINGNIVSTI